MGKRVKRVKRKNKKKVSSKKLFKFILYQIFFIIITTPLLVFRGPFKNVKNTVVGTIMATRHQSLATIFLSKAEVDDIMNKSASAVSNDIQDKNEVKVENKGKTRIERYDINTKRFDGYILEINNPSSVKVGVTKKLGKVGQRTSEIAEDNGAIAAINGGAFYDQSPNGNFAGTGAFPGGITISDGKLIENNIKEDEKSEIVGFTEDGILMIGDYTYRELKKMHVTQAVSFGAINSKLIINGKPQIRGDGGLGLNPRTAIAQKRDGTVIFLVIDGRGIVKEGASLREIQDILLKRGAWNAYNLDGGSSTTMYHNGQVINNPSNWDGERTVATAFYVID